jgi:hypothetical protein
VKSSRREFIVAAGVLWQQAVVRAQQHHGEHSSAPQSAQYTFSYLDQPRREALRRLMSRIIPADGRSGGAIGAKVDEYIDFILSHAAPALQETWRSGLDRYGRATAGLNAEEIDAFLSKHARNEFAPVNENERFFVLLKAAVVEGFYTSQEGIEKELGYKGMSFGLDFPGCTDTVHEVPPTYKPALRQREG